MKWNSAAKIVIDRLAESGRLNSNDKAELLELIGSFQGNEAFRKTFSILSSQGWAVGWNKFWQGHELFGWYGDSVTRQSLRHVALEIESHSETCTDIRRWIISLPHPRVVRAEASGVGKLPLTLKQAKSTPSIADMLEEVSPLLGIKSKPLPKPTPKPAAIKLSITAAKTSEISAPAKMLGSLGIDASQRIRDKDRMRLLQRLNLDQRDLPFIEQWKWNSSTGTATLSDGGRIDVKPEVIWTNAVEKALASGKGFDPQLVNFLNSIDPENLETPLVELPERSEALINVLDYLEQCHFARVMFDRIRFRAKVGDFPRKLLVLFHSAA